MNRSETNRTCVTLGPIHEGLPGALQLELEMDGEVIDRSLVHIGFEHRGFEKHAENLHYTGLPPFVERLDFNAQLHSCAAFALALERLLRIRPSDTVQYVRMVMLEFDRIFSHLGFFVNISRILNLSWFSSHVSDDRDMLQKLFQEVSGNPFFGRLFRKGGLAKGIDKDWLAKVRSIIGYLKLRTPFYRNMLLDNPFFILRTAGIGVLSDAAAISYGVTGPCLRGAGVRNDVRKDAPYLLYPYIEFDAPVGTGEKGTQGDAWDRCSVRCSEILQSIRIIEQILERIDISDLDKSESDLPGAPLPVLSVYQKTESPRGELGFYMKGDGTLCARRVKMRSPSFSNLHAAEHLLRGIRYADIFVIIASLDISMNEVDR